MGNTPSCQAGNVLDLDLDPLQKDIKAPGQERPIGIPFFPVSRA